MTNKRIFAFFFFLSIFSSCESEKPHIKQVNRLFSSLKHETTTASELELFSIGGEFSYDVKKISIGFLVYLQPTVEEARILAMKLLNEILKKINDNLEIRPYLHDYPFTKKNIELTLYFKGHGASTNKTYVSIFCIDKGKIIYQMNNVKNTFVEENTETYEDEAKRAAEHL